MIRRHRQIGSGTLPSPPGLRSLAATTDSLAPEGESEEGSEKDLKKKIWTRVDAGARVRGKEATIEDVANEELWVVLEPTARPEEGIKDLPDDGASGKGASRIRSRSERCSGLRR